MYSFKEPLAKHPNNIFSQRFTGAAACDVPSLMDELADRAPREFEANYGFKTTCQKDSVSIGGLFKKKEYPALLFYFPGTSYAQILITFNKVGAIIDIDAIPVGGVSKNMQHSNLSQVDHGFSLSGMMKSAYHKAMTDTNAIEEEEMHYQGLIQTVASIVVSWVA